MIRSFIHCFKSEWLKTRRTTAFWLVVIGGFFIPAILIAVRIINSNQLVAIIKMSSFGKDFFSKLANNGCIFIADGGNFSYQPYYSN